METLLAALAIFAVLAIAIAVIAAPLFVIQWLLRGPRNPPPTVLHQDRRWTDDDEIAARHHL